MINDIMDYARKKAEHYEVYYAEVDELIAEINNNKINFISDGSTRSMGVRVVVDGKPGFAYTSDIGTYKACVDNAVKIAGLNDKDPNFKSFAKPKMYKDLHILDRNTASIDADNIHDFNEELLNAIHAVNKDMIISGASFSRDIMTMHVMNSEGVDFKERNASNIYQYSLVLKNNGKLETVEASNGSRSPMDATDMGREGAERLKAMLNRQQAPSAMSQIVLHPEALADLLAQSYAFAVNAENVQHKKSPFAGKLGQQVFSEKISITDDGTGEGMFCTRSCDAEGTPTRKFATVENGVLKNLLYDSYTANKDNTESTGNAYRSSSTQPSIGTNNVILMNGDSKDLVGEMKEGLYVRGLLGVHTMNEATGDFSLSVLEGHYVKDGEIQFPVKDTMIAGNFFEMMKEVDALGKSAKPVLKRAIFAGNGGYYIPDALFPKIKVIGK